MDKALRERIEDTFFAVVWHDGEVHPIATMREAVIGDYLASARELIPLIAEECAKVCDAEAHHWRDVGGLAVSSAEDCAAVIREKFKPGT